VSESASSAADIPEGRWISLFAIAGLLSIARSWRKNWCNGSLLGEVFANAVVDSARKKDYERAKSVTASW